MTIKSRLARLEVLLVERHAPRDCADGDDGYGRWLRREGPEPPCRPPPPSWRIDAAEWEAGHRLGIAMGLRLRGDLGAGEYPAGMGADDRVLLDGYMAALFMVCMHGAGRPVDAMEVQ